MFDFKVFMVKKYLNNMGAKIQHKKNKNEMFNVLQTFIFQPKTDVTNILFKKYSC